MPDPLPISAITTCKGRLAHLKQTLPSLTALALREVIVVDYDCPEGAGDWVAASGLPASVVRLKDRPQFNVAKARNLGAAAASSPWLLFIDVDIRPRPGAAGALAGAIAHGGFWVADPRPADLYGLLLVSREDFDAVGGYDEVFEGWGIEDVELEDRLEAAGCARGRVNGHLFEIIAHDDRHRAQFHEVANRMANGTINNVYRWAKADLRRLGVELDRTGRGALYAQLRRGLAEEGVAGEFEVSFRDVWTFNLTLSASLKYRLHEPGAGPQAPSAPASSSKSST